MEPLIASYQSTRTYFLEITSGLELEDYGLQADVFVSPPKWHLAHTSWFFETFILKPFVEGYQVFHPEFEYLFNSYYNSVGEQFNRHQRGLLSRPTLSEVMAYRKWVDQEMVSLLSTTVDADVKENIEQVCQLGIQHEKQHQELFLMDIKYNFFQNPLYPALLTGTPERAIPSNDRGWKSFKSGLYEIGADKHAEFCFDNEQPRHKFFVNEFSLAKQLVTNGEYLAFIEEGGYQTPEFWLADGWSFIQQRHWQAPLYWLKKDNTWYEFTLYGLLPLDLNRPVTHVSAYEANAYASWAGARLPTEAEWELAGQRYWDKHHPPEDTNLFLAAGAPSEAKGVQQLFNAGWQWTSSAYQAYPGYRAAAGALGEYNGKFMSNQSVLRGGSALSPDNHLRPTYRNFFYPSDRWPMTAIRLAK